MTPPPNHAQQHREDFPGTISFLSDSYQVAGPAQVRASPIQKSSPGQVQKNRLSRLDETQQADERAPQTLAKVPLLVPKWGSQIN